MFRFNKAANRTVGDDPASALATSLSGSRPSAGPSRKIRRICAVALPGLLLALALTAVIAVRLDAPPASAETPARQVEVGQSHACVLEPDGLVTCWGEDASGQVSDWGRWRYRSQRFVSISAGSFFTCGILTSGSVMCWGHPEKEDGSNKEADNRDWNVWAANPDADYEGWVNTPPSTVKFKPGSLSVGNFHACAIRTSGALSCWGKAGDARLVIPTDGDKAITDWTTVEAGFANACAVRAGGSVVCFGRTSHGRSDGPSGAGPFVDVTVGVYHGCALAGDGSVECWGNHPGLGQYNANITTPTPGVTFTAIEMSTAEFHGCGLGDDKKIHCWGIVLSTGHLPRVDPPGGSFASISVGGPNSCALDSDGYLTCWGDDDGGLLTPPSGAFTQTSGGAGFSCALKADGTIACWGGDNANQQLDAPSGTFTLVSVGDTHGCAIRSDKTVACWGGVSGNPPTPHAAATAPTTGTFTTLDAGVDLTCGIKTDETIECWGDDRHDRLNEPSGAFSRVAVGATHVCAIKNDRSMVCWGETTFFDREGDGNPDDIGGKGNHTTTTPPSGRHRYIDVDAGEGHTCAIREDHRAVCWGYHADGRNNVPGYLSDPQGFSGADFSDIATGGPNNCAIRSEGGSLACWNSEKPQYWPGSEILAMTGFKSLGAGTSHMCGIDRADGLVCWGVAGILAYPPQLGQTIPDFADVPGGHSAEDAIRWAAREGITVGVGSNRFGIGRTLTRYQMVTFLCRAFSGTDCRSGTTRGSDTFEDVPRDHWANSSIGWAVEGGITTGVSATEFGGSQTLTREQTAAFLHRVKGSPSGGSGGSDIYDDVPTDHWADQPIGWAYDLGIIPGVDSDTFGFGSAVTREEMALFLCRTVAPDVCARSN